MRNPKDSFSIHLCGYMSDEEFPKATMMKILRTKIALKFHSTDESNFGLDNEYSPTLNRNINLWLELRSYFVKLLKM